jgi:Uncharacterised protein conserved in bacteria (DUF2336)
MSDPRERLTRLVELATQNAPEKRRMLATELCDLLLDWPENYPPAMREPFETLLEKTMRLIDREARHALIARIAAADHVTLDFLNEFFFEAPADLRQTILARNAAATAPASEPCPAIDEADLIDGARREIVTTFAARFARVARIDIEIAERILRDASAASLAIAARGAHLSRAAFSAIALLADGARTPDETIARLAAYDGVSQDGAETMLRFWRMRAPQRPAKSA